MKWEIKKVDWTNDTRVSYWGELSLEIDSEEVAIAHTDELAESYGVHVIRERLSNKLMECKIIDYQIDIASIMIDDRYILNTYADYHVSEVTTSVKINRRDDPYSKVEFNYTLSFDLKEWKKTYSVINFVKQISKISRDEKLEIDDYSGLEGNYNREEYGEYIGFYIEIEKAFSINEVLKPLSEKVLYFLTKAQENLLQNTKKDQLHSSFKFPPEIKTACEQYLIYFTQFLMDLGIKANSNIENKDGKTLFSVVPEDSEQALSEIHSALETYLSLVTYPEVEVVISENNDIAAMHLNSQIANFKSQYALAIAQVESKNAIIAAKDAMIAAKDAKISANEASIYALQETNRKMENKIEVLEGKKVAKIFWGLVEIKDWDMKPFPVTMKIPELIKSLKRNRD